MVELIYSLAHWRRGPELRGKYTIIQLLGIKFVFVEVDWKLNKIKNVVQTVQMTTAYIISLWKDCLMDLKKNWKTWWLLSRSMPIMVTVLCGVQKWIDHRLQCGKILSPFTGCAETFQLCRTYLKFYVIFLDSEWRILDFFYHNPWPLLSNEL